MSTQDLWTEIFDSIQGERAAYRTCSSRVAKRSCQALYLVGANATTIFGSPRRCRPPLCVMSVPLNFRQQISRRTQTSLASLLKGLQPRGMS